MPCRSVPAPGSVSPRPERSSPVAIGGRYRRFCSSVPLRATSQQATEWMPIEPGRAEPAASDLLEGERVADPVDAEAAVLLRHVEPEEAELRQRPAISAGYVPDRSSSWATGMISLSAKSRSVLRNRRCSSVSSKSTTGLLPGRVLDRQHVVVAHAGFFPVLPGLITGSPGPPSGSRRRRQAGQVGRWPAAGRR